MCLCVSCYMKIEIIYLLVYNCLTTLCLNITEVKSEKSKPVPAPKPKVIIERPREELAALEHLVNALRSVFFSFSGFGDWLMI